MGQLNVLYRSLQIETLEISDSPKYRLIAVVHHKGTMNSGHYWVNIMTKDGEWWDLNDSVKEHITSISRKTLQIAIYVKAEHFQITRKNIIDIRLEDNTTSIVFSFRSSSIKISHCSSSR